MKRKRKRTLTERLVALLLRLYPADFRRRFGADIQAEARRMTGHGRSRASVVLDTAATLVRAWGHRVVGGRGRPAGASSGRTGHEHGSHRGHDGTSRPGLASVLTHDVRYALRRVRRSPLHALVVVGTLAVALGANVAVFAVTWAVLLTGLPYPGAERVSRVDPAPTSVRTSGGGFEFVLSPYVDELPTVEAVALYYDDGTATLVQASGASRVAVSQVSAGFFRTLGVRPVLGRTLQPDDTDAAVLSHDLWRSAFGADPDVLGRRLELSGHPYRVVGVAPPDVSFPGRTRVWTSLPTVPDFYGAAIAPSALVRQRPGTSAAALQEGLRAGAEARAEAAGQSIPPDRRIVLTGLEQVLRGELRAPLLVLLGASVLVFLLGCLNIAGVSMSRATTRLPEMHVRRSLGAGRGRIALQLLVESTTLAAAGAVGAVGLAVWAVPALLRWLPSEAPGLDGVDLGGPVLAVVALGAVLAGVLTGGLPAMYAARRASRPAARDGRAGGPASGRVQLGLTVTQVALAVVLVTGSVLLGRSLINLRSVPLGFDRQGVLTFQLRLPSTSYPSEESRSAFTEDLRARLAALPGVETVGVSSRLPFSEGLGRGYRISRAEEGAGDTLSVAGIEASAGYLDAMGIELLEGRAFRPEGEDGSVVVLAAAAARRLFGETGAVGRTIHVHSWGEPRRATVVGVAEDVRLHRVTGEAQPQMYEPLSEQPQAWLGLVLRTAGDPLEGVAPARRTVAELDPALAPWAFRTTEQTMREVLAGQEALARVSTVFGGVALLLALLGVYGLLAQGVARRRREMGIRMALGARKTSVLARVVLTGTGFAAVGAAVGLGASLAAAGLLEGVLHGIDARDPATFVAVPLGTLAVAVLATVLPARRAASVDPSEALREE